MPSAANGEGHPGGGFATATDAISGGLDALGSEQRCGHLNFAFASVTLAA